MIAVSDKAQLKKTGSECERLPEEFQRALALWEALEAQKVSESLQSAIDVINRLGLVQGAF